MSRLRRVGLAALLAAGLLGAPAATTPAMAQTQSGPAAVADPDAVVPARVEDPLVFLEAPGDKAILSDELSVTRSANAMTPTVIRAQPRGGARVVGRLRYLTEDRVPEVYVVLEGLVDEAGRVWMRIRIPARPNGRTGWVLNDALSEMRVVLTRLVIDRRALRATLFRRNVQVWTSRVGIGKAGTPTPRGVFYIRERLRGLGGVYGPWAFGTSAYSNLSDWPGGGVVGIHGTNQPGLIPGRPSHGCVRVPNAKIRQLARLMPVGTPVHIVR